MIETPRAALLAGEIAEVADFFSFGTNDLTQMTFGFSRDDVEGRMMSAYLDLGLLPRNPFDVVDFDGVGELVRLGTERGRKTRPDLKVGVCGEHGGDPESIGMFYDAGLDYVSCSPFRVPVARLAAAQAVIAAGRATEPAAGSSRGNGRRPSSSAPAKRGAPNGARAKGAGARRAPAKSSAAR
jgi:pyruvate,orthophosphate dikinase